MAISRYDDRIIMLNDNDMYQEMAEQRGINYFRQYNTAEFTYPTAQQIATLTIVSRVWHTGDSFNKLADRHYGRFTLGRVIALFNKKRSEFDVKPGEIIRIPFPLDRVLTMFNL